MGEKTSEKNRIHPTIIEISGVRFIYLNDYALTLLNLSFEQARELINKELETAGAVKKEVNTLSKHRKPPEDGSQAKDHNFYIET